MNKIHLCWSMQRKAVPRHYPRVLYKIFDKTRLLLIG